MSTIERLRALLDYLTDGLAPGPFHAIESGDKAAYGWWLDNAAGDSSFPDPDDVAVIVNALPALLDVAEAARAVCDSPLHTRELEPTVVFDALRAALNRLEAS